MRKTLFLIALLSSVLLLNGQHSHSLDQSSSKFIENKGQWPADILYYSQLPGAEVAIKQGEINYLLKDNKKYDALLALRHGGALTSPKNIKQGRSIDLEPDPNQVDYHLIKMEIIGSQPAEFKGHKSYKERRNYLRGDDSTKWAKNVYSYQAVTAENILDGVKFKIYHHSGSMKHEFHVDRLTDYKKIKLRYSGYDNIKINNKGELELSTSLGLLKEDHPVAYQVVKGKHRYVKCEFILNKDKTISYSLGRNYNKRYPLIIDPQLIFSTASGSTADNWGNTACLDNKGNLYTGGTVFSTNRGTTGISSPAGFPSTAGAFSQSFDEGDTDIGILKFDSSGQNLIYATYIGGNDSEIPTSTITNDAGELFILGVTGSTNFPGRVNTFSGGIPFTPVGGYVFNNGSDIVILKLSADGSNLIKSRYVGGPLNDGANLKRSSINVNDAYAIINYGDELRGELVIDAEENIYVASSTNNAQLITNLNQSTNFPTKNAFQPAFGGGRQDGIVFKMHSSMDSLVWSSYLGGSGADAAYGLKISPDSSIYVTGIVGSGNIFNRDTNALNPDFLGSYDAYIARISPEGDSILNYTYLGTPEKDAGYLIEVDNTGFPYALGQTFGDYGHSSDTIFFIDREGVFIHKLTPELDSSLYFTTIGDTLANDISPNFSPTAFLINECGNVFISGWGGTTNYPWTGNTFRLPTTQNAFSRQSDGSDFYLAVFLKDMDTLLFATYFGVNGVAEHVDGGTSRFDESGIVYQSVCAGCGGREFITFPNPSTGNYPKQNLSGNCTNGVFKYDLASLDAVIATEDDCGPLTTTFTNETLGGIEYFWDFGDGENVTVTNKAPVTHTYTNAGRYTVNMITTDITTCKRKDTTALEIRVSDNLIEEVNRDTLCKDETLLVTRYNELEFDSFKWQPTLSVSNDTIRNPIITATKTEDITLRLVDSLGCDRTDTLKLFVPEFKPDLVLDVIPNCKQNSLPKLNIELNSTGNFTPNEVTWDINGTTITTPDSSFLYTPSQTGNQLVISSTKSKNCEFTDTASVNIVKTEIPNVITPNGDGLNDEFILKGIQGDELWSLSIHNRWGKTIYETDNYKNDWNAPETVESTYFYELTSPDGDKCKGWLQVLR